MIEIVTSQSKRFDSEHLSSTSSSPASASSERSIETKIQVLLIPRALAISTSPPSSFSENNENRELRKSGRQMKIRNFWENEFVAFLAMMAVVEASMHYKNILNRKDRRKWKRAMDIEYKSIMKNKTWKLITRPTRANVIDSRWTYKLKHDDLHKTRFVAKSYLQYSEFDFDEIYASIARFSTIQMLIAIAARLDFKIHQMDIITAFLYEELEERIYIE